MSARRVGRAWLSVLGALASVIAVACTTDLGTNDGVSFARSRLLGATSANVVRVLERDGVVVWFDSAANVFTCPAAGCDAKATLLTSASNVYAGATYGQYSLYQPVPAALAAGHVFWATGGTLYSCALNGCPNGPAVVVAGDAEINRIVTDGTTIAWSTTNGASISLCAAASCVPRAAQSTCAQDADCSADKPVCMQGRCVACGDNYSRKGACKGATPTCGSDFTCVGCDPDGGGTCNQGGKNTCDPATRTCVRCLTADQCALGFGGKAAACIGGACVKCDGDYGSGKPSACPAEKPTCDAQGNCGPCDATTCAAPNQCTQYGCLTPCAAAADCDAAHTCFMSYCLPKQPLGAPCSNAVQCVAGTCSSGVCGKAASAACTTDGECAAGVCGADKKCGIEAGGACTTQAQCRSGGCHQRVCGGSSGSGYSSYTSAAGSTIVVAGGRLYYSIATQGPSGSATASIVSCAVGECPAGTKPVYAPADGTAPLAVGGDASTLYFVSIYGGSFGSSGPSGELFRCDLPACPAPVAMGLGSATRVEVVGNDAFVYDFQTSSIVHCTRDTCASSTQDPIPDADLGNTGAGGLASRPFAVDATTTYWATDTIFGNTGNLVVATPR